MKTKYVEHVVVDTFPISHPGEHQTRVTAGPPTGNHTAATQVEQLWPLHLLPEPLLVHHFPDIPHRLRRLHKGPLHIVSHKHAAASIFCWFVCLFEV